MIFTKERPLTIGTDDFGSYGTIFAPDSDHEVPNPDESTTQLSPPHQMIGFESYDRNALLSKDRESDWKLTNISGPLLR